MGLGLLCHRHHRQHEQDVVQTSWTISGWFMAEVFGLLALLVFGEDTPVFLDKFRYVLIGFASPKPRVHLACNRACVLMTRRYRIQLVLTWPSPMMLLVKVPGFVVRYTCQRVSAAWCPEETRTRDTEKFLVYLYCLPSWRRASQTLLSGISHGFERTWRLMKASPLRYSPLPAFFWPQSVGEGTECLWLVSPRWCS